MKLESKFKYFLNGKQISEEQYKRLKPNLSVTFKGDEVICRLDVKSGSLAEAYYLDEVLKSELGETSKWYETTTDVNDMRINPDAIKLFKTFDITPIDLFLKGESNGNESLKDVLDRPQPDKILEERRQQLSNMIDFIKEDVELRKEYNYLHPLQKQEIKTVSDIMTNERFIPNLEKREFPKNELVNNKNTVENNINSKLGHKESNGKLSYELDWDFIEQMASRMSKNKDKYEPYNWQKPIDIEGLKQALFRHVMDVMRGNYSDDGRELGHLESVALNAMIINYQLKNKQ